MPWQISDEMSEKRRFIQSRLSGVPMSEACRVAGISRQTGYKIWNRFKAEGDNGLGARSRAPKGNSRSVDDDVITQLIEVRRKHPGWGLKDPHKSGGRE